MTVPHDFAGILNNVVHTRNSILQNACVPQRNDDSGGSTGVAMSDATGWSSAEMSATQVQAMQEASKMNEVKLFVPNMNCMHCVARINDAIKSVKGIENIQIDLETKTVSFSSEKDKSIEKAINAIKKAGYEVKN